MGTKHISNKKETFKLIQSAVEKLVDTIKPTFGPASNKVVIDKIPYRMVVDDGVQIARDFQLDDEQENAIVNFVKGAAIKTNDRAGDGTTGAMIILQALVREIGREIDPKGHSIERELKKGVQEVIEQLKAKATPIESKEDLKKVAMVSFDDEGIANLIADMYHKIGKDGVVTLARSNTMDTYTELTEGVKITNGYISPYMVTDAERMEAVIEKPYILLTDYRLTESSDIMPILEKMVKAGKHDLVVIAENVEQQALATIVSNLSTVMNRQTGKTGMLRCVAINAPKVANQKIFLEDLAMMTGGTLFTESMGDTLEGAELKDLGRAERFISKRDESIIVEPKGNKEDVDSAVKSLKQAIETEVKESNRKELEQRVGMFTGTLAVIKVGAPTDEEQKALQYKVEDAVNSVKSAFQNGVVCGGGLALRGITTSSPILNRALEYPSYQLFINMEMQYPLLAEGQALNVITGETGPYLEVGVIDPVDVLIAGVESAVSIASILATSAGMICETRDEEK